ncbi:NAD(P)-binding protein [Hypoxylon rubiginosum]|uniref:NAD(P)-binding protein n=1 Tax=Hypoxylon rubiginosum TaxID=110542 RepID=A0ACB9Z3V6_9PEZI|nr:NAD(P)-binding protein [Hypoxylon rubiginosum]
MTSPKRTVLITGCSDGGMGADLAVAFHKAGLKVYATARNPAKMEKLAAQGIETLSLDVLSESSIAECAAKLPGLDILVNNAGQGYAIPVVDMDVAEARKMFDVNVWAPVSVIQGFLPLLLKSPSPVVVNHTSVLSVFPLPFQGPYAASKAALAMITDCLRVELQPWGIRVVDLKTGAVRTNFIANAPEFRLPENSIYGPARADVEKTNTDLFAAAEFPSDRWARETVQDLLRKSPAPALWRGDGARLGRLSAVLPYGMFDGTLKKMVGLDVVERVVKKRD